MQIKHVCHVLQVLRLFIFRYLHLFIFPPVHHLFVYIFPTTEPSQHSSVVKVAVSLLESLLDGHSDIIIGKMFPMKAILHWARQVKV
jgi:hypothetical protein